MTDRCDLPSNTGLPFSVDSSTGNTTTIARQYQARDHELRVRRADDDRGRGRWLYAVNARFGATPTNGTAYWITRVRK